MVTGAQLARGREEDLHCLFWEILKVLLFWKNMTRLCSSMSYIFHLRFCLRVCRRKNSYFFRCRAFLSCVVDEMLIEVPLLHKNLPCPEKFLVVLPDKFILIFNFVLFLLHICFF